MVTNWADPCCPWNQELIAPEIVEFYDRNWHFRDTKAVLKRRIANITGIDEEVLQDSSLLPEISIARRMSWAANRVTQRIEDMAYSLLGIFDVNMPLIYGEGHRAFQRLQEEIARTSNDLSLFAWTAHVDGRDGVRRAQEYRGIFAKSPTEFMNCRDIEACRDQIAPLKEFSMSNNGCLRIETYLAPDPNKDYIFALDCTDGSEDEQHRQRRIGIRLMKTDAGYVRCRFSETYTTFDKNFWNGKPVPVYIRKELTPTQSYKLRTRLQSAIVFHVHIPPNTECHKLAARPRNHWDSIRRTFLTNNHTDFTAYASFYLRPRYWRFVIISGLIDPHSRDPQVVGVPEGQGVMLPFATILTDQDSIGKRNIEAIDKIMANSNPDHDERGLSRLRDLVLGWHTDRHGRLDPADMLGESHVAYDPEYGEIKFYLAMRRDYQDGIPVFNLSIFIEELNRIQGQGSDAGSNNTDLGLDPGAGFEPRYVPQPPRARTPAPEPSPFEPRPRGPGPGYAGQLPQRPVFGNRAQPFVPINGGWANGSPYSPPMYGPASPGGYGPGPGMYGPAPPPDPNAGPFSPNIMPSPQGPFMPYFSSPTYVPGYGYGDAYRR